METTIYTVRVTMMYWKAALATTAYLMMMALIICTEMGTIYFRGLVKIDTMAEMETMRYMHGQGKKII